ncbi:MAG: hypothetical protein AAFU49_18660 [Pseudomonadota bacterium]
MHRSAKALNRARRPWSLSAVDGPVLDTVSKGLRFAGIGVDVRESGGQDGLRQCAVCVGRLQPFNAPMPEFGGFALWVRTKLPRLREHGGTVSSPVSSLPSLAVEPALSEIG